MNGSSSIKSTPAKARRTGNPSPSKPCGAVVTLFTRRARLAAPFNPIPASTRGKTVISLTVTAGTFALLGFGRLLQNIFHLHYTKYRT